jgi:hypothetical protein
VAGLSQSSTVKPTQTFTIGNGNRQTCRAVLITPSIASEPNDQDAFRNLMGKARGKIHLQRQIRKGRRLHCRSQPRSWQALPQAGWTAACCTHLRIAESSSVHSRSCADAKDGLTRHLIDLVFDGLLYRRVRVPDACDSGTTTAVDHPPAIFQSNVDPICASGHRRTPRGSCRPDQSRDMPCLGSTHLWRM